MANLCEHFKISDFIEINFETDITFDDNEKNIIFRTAIEEKENKEEYVLKHDYYPNKINVGKKVFKTLSIIVKIDEINYEFPSDIYDVDNNYLNTIIILAQNKTEYVFKLDNLNKLYYFRDNNEIFIKIDNIEDRKNSICGGFGCVIFYQNDNNQKRIAAKIGDIENDLEINKYISENRETFPCLKNIGVGVERIFFNKSKIFFMNYADYDFYDIRYKIDKNIKKEKLFDIISKIIDYLECLMKHDMYYTDIKLDNIFYKCIGNGVNDYEIIMGDIGSIELIKPDDFKIGRFPTYTYGYNQNKISKLDNYKEICIQIMNFGFGFIILYLLMDYQYKELFSLNHNDIKLLYKSNINLDLFTKLIYPFSEHKMHDSLTKEQKEKLFEMIKKLIDGELNFYDDKVKDFFKSEEQKKLITKDNPKFKILTKNIYENALQIYY